MWMNKLEKSNSTNTSILFGILVVTLKCCAQVKTMCSMWLMNVNTHFVVKLKLIFPTFYVLLPSLKTQVYAKNFAESH